MRQNPINTAAGKSRKNRGIPSDQHTPEHTLAGFDTPTINHLQVVNLKCRRNALMWVIEVTPWNLQNFSKDAVKSGWTARPDTLL